jgi:Raf kinase inhibitor-like YbhB/YbcL family protein
MKLPLLLLLSFFTVAAISFTQQGGNMNLESSAFVNGQPIPQKHTCQGADLSPALTWSGAPANTKSFALIVDDPDAPVGDWVHWMIYNLPASAHNLPEGVSRTEKTHAGVQLFNDFKKIGYGGPCPPPGKPHRYFFKLYALDTALNVSPKASKQDLEEALKAHVLAKAELMGTYRRK